jgi:hypothetical protein
LSHRFTPRLTENRRGQLAQLPINSSHMITSQFLVIMYEANDFATIHLIHAVPTPDPCCILQVDLNLCAADAEACISACREGSTYPIRSSSQGDSIKVAGGWDSFDTRPSVFRLFGERGNTKQVSVRSKYACVLDFYVAR